MFVELHMLQNFAPSCLNRDDTNSPKDCEFGGYRRARISSQCIKRAKREYFKKNHEKLGLTEKLAERSRLWPREMIEALQAAGKPEEDARLTTAFVLGATSFWLDKKDSNRTSVLVFNKPQGREQLLEGMLNNWQPLLEAAKPFEKKLISKKKEKEEEIGDEQTAVREGQKGKQKLSNEIEEKLPPKIKELVQSIKSDVNTAADIALFGRMLADLTDMNVQAACQVAHAFSTNQVSMEFDFYTAVDDLSPKEETGAGMMGTVEFNSACFYRYANIDFTQLTENLGGDIDLAQKTVGAFLEAAVKAVPTGKQTSMAAQNLPSFVFAVVRDHGLWSLANAFVDPVRPGRDDSLVQKSTAALEEYWARLAAAYGEGGIRAKAALAVDCALTKLKGDQKDSLKDLMEAILKALPQKV